MNVLDFPMSSQCCCYCQYDPYSGAVVQALCTGREFSKRVDGVGERYGCWCSETEVGGIHEATRELGSGINRNWA